MVDDGQSHAELHELQLRVRLSAEFDDLGIGGCGEFAGTGCPAGEDEPAGLDEVGDSRERSPGFGCQPVHCLLELGLILDPSAAGRGARHGYGVESRVEVLSESRQSGAYGGGQPRQCATGLSLGFADPAPRLRDAGLDEVAPLLLVRFDRG